jgi:hypothetical protein
MTVSEWILEKLGGKVWTGFTLAQDRDLWWALMNIEMNVQTPQIAIISSSRSTLLYGISELLSGLHGQITLNYKLERTCNEMVKAYFKVLSQNMPRVNERNHTKPQSGQTVSGMRRESGTSKIQNRNTNHRTTMFGLASHTHILGLFDVDIF